MIDPPAGWRYGFPKPAPSLGKSEEELIKWFLENGYPQHEIDNGGLKWVRYFESHKVENSFSDKPE